MKNRFFNFVLVSIAVLALLQINAVAQTRGRNTAAAASLMESLPKSDAVVQVKMKQLFN